MRIVHELVDVVADGLQMRFEPAGAPVLRGLRGCIDGVGGEETLEPIIISRSSGT